MFWISQPILSRLTLLLVQTWGIPNHKKKEIGVEEKGMEQWNAFLPAETFGINKRLFFLIN